jgi:putative inorganic carbon (hco3(-)) transporter
MPDVEHQHGIGWTPLLNGANTRRLESHLMRNIAVLLVIAVGLVYSLGSRLGSVLFYWWFAIFRPQDWIYLDVTALRLSLVVGVIVVVGCLLAGRMPRLVGPVPVLMVVLLALEAWATVSAGCGPWGWTKFESLARMFLLLFLTARIIQTPRQLVLLLFVVGISLGFYASKAGLMAMLAGGASQYGASNLAGSFSGSNAFALGTAVSIFFVIAVALNLPTLLDKLAVEESGADRFWVKYVKWGLLLCVFLSTFNVLSLSSRGSSLAMGVGVLVFILHRKNSGKVLLKIVPVLLVIALAVPLPDGFSERMASVFATEEERDRSAASRPHLWAVSSAIAADHPLGVGSLCYFAYYNLYDPSNGFYGKSRSVHSAHFQILAEAGYLGLVVWALMFVISLIQLARVRKRSRHRGLPVPEQRFFESTASALFCSILVFGLGSSFYETAHMEVIWIAFIASSLLSRLSIDTLEHTIAKPDAIVGHHAAATSTKRRMRPSIYRD